MGDFDYQEKVWGGTDVGLTPKYLAYLKLKYTLDDLKKVKGRVLDAGCGAGGFAKAIKFYRPDLDIYGVDIGKKAIAQAQKESYGVEFSLGDLYKLPFKNGSFDAVVVEDVLEHLEKPFAALSEINRVLVTKGTFSAYIPLEGSVFSLHYWLGKLGWKAKEKLAGHINKFRNNSLSSSLRKSGFDVEKQRYMTHLLGQLVDVGYFSILAALGSKLEVSLEEDLKNKPVRKFLKDTITRFTNLESQVLSFVPGAGVHLACRKLN